MPAYQFITLNDEVDLPTPSFSVHFIPITTADEIQGRNAGGLSGMHSYGLMEVNCWVSRGGNPDYLAQLNTMVAMVQDAVIRYPVVVIKDYLSNPMSPSTTEYKINMGNIEVTPTEHDPNVDLERRRLLCRFDWWQRVG